MMLRMLACLVATALLVSSPIAAQAPQQPPTPPKVRELLDLLADPGVQDWLKKQRTAAPAHRAPDTKPGEDDGLSPGARVASVRKHLAALVAAVPMVPDALHKAGTILMLELEERGLFEVLALIVAFIALGFGAEWLYYRAAARLERFIAELPLDSVNERLRAVAIRLAYGTGIVASFAIGSVGAFLVFDWPPLLREIVSAICWPSSGCAWRWSSAASCWRPAASASASCRCRPRRLVLVPPLRRLRRLVRLRLGHRAVDPDARRFARSAPSRRLCAGTRPPGDRPGVGLAPAAPGAVPEAIAAPARRRISATGRRRRSCRPTSWCCGCCGSPAPCRSSGCWSWPSPCRRRWPPRSAR